MSIIVPLPAADGPGVERFKQVVGLPLATYFSGTKIVWILENVDGAHITRFLDDRTLASMFIFPLDMAAVPVEINRLDNQALVRYYETEWRRYE